MLSRTIFATLAICLLITGCAIELTKDPVVHPEDQEALALIEKRAPGLFEQDEIFALTVARSPETLDSFLTDDDYAKKLLFAGLGGDASSLQLTPYQDIQQALPTATQNLGCGLP